MEENLLPHHGFPGTGYSITAKKIAIFFHATAIPPFTERLEV